MICDVSDPEATQTEESVTARKMRAHWWGHLSPWLWGLVIVLAIAATQVPRISSMVSKGEPKSGPAALAVAPTLSGKAYSQAMVAGRDFVGADLRGARLAHLDLRGTDFQRADAAGAVFTGSLLNGANFSQANLRGADLRDTCMRGSILTGAKLAGSDFTGADVTGTTVTSVATSNAIGWGSSLDSSACSGS
jgi:hypothetical protein